MKQDNKILFFGTPEFAATSLAQLIKDGHNITGVFTQADKPSGRGKQLTQPPVKILAQENNLPVYQPLKLKDAKETLTSLSFDLIVIVAYGKIIPSWLINLPKFKAINLHSSLLPKYRGASPITGAILNGETKSGVTTMLIDEGLDTGDILLQEEVSISEDDNAGSLHDKLADIGSKLLSKTIHEWIAGKIIPKKQNNADATVTTLIKKEDGKLDFSQTSVQCCNKIRAYTPWPSSFVITQSGKTIKILNAHPIKDQSLPITNYKNGEVISWDKNGLYIKTQDGIIGITSLQMEGKRPIQIKDFCNAPFLKQGEILK